MVIASALEELDDRERELVRGVRWQTKERPDTEDLARGVVPHQLGSYIGVPHDRRADPLDDDDWSMSPNTGPAEGTITIYLENLRPLTAEKIRRVFLHEVSHALGYTEEEITGELGLTLEGCTG